MKACHTLICFFFLTALQDGDTGEPRWGEEGTNITVACSLSWFGSRRFFCRETCEGENILIETTEDRAKRGRYSIQYEDKDHLSADLMNVSITGLKKSDSGKYRCQSDKTWGGTLYEDFDLIVTEASTSSEPNWTPSTSPSTFLSSAFLTTTTLTQRLSSSSSSSSSETRTSTGPKGLLLYVVLSLVAKIILLSTPLVIFCWKRRLTKSNDPAVETEHAVVSQTNPETEITRGGLIKSSAEEISSV